MWPKPRMLVPALVLAALAGCASDPATWPPYDLEPAATETPGLAVIERGGLRVEVEPLGREARAEWLADRAGTGHDPLDERGLRDRLLTFRVRIDALGDGPLHFQPQNAALYRGQGKAPVMPLDYTRVFELLGSRSGEPTTASREQMRRFMRGLWDSAVTVPEGESMEGLLIFPAPRRFEPPLVLRLMLVRESTRVERLAVPMTPRVRGPGAAPPV